MIHKRISYGVTVGVSILKGIITRMYQPNRTLIPVQSPLTDLVPDFFTNDIQCYQLPMTLTPEGTNTTSNSFMRLEIPLGTNPKSRLPFERFTSSKIRIGRLLELMDSMAGFSIMKYAKASINSIETHPFAIATACVDSIYLDDTIDCESDLYLQSYVNFVGQTSLEVEVNILQNEGLRASAFFTMVARDKTNIGKGGQGYPLPKLVFVEEPDIAKCNAREARGKQARIARLDRVKRSLETTVPTTEEITLLHSFFTNKTESQLRRTPNSTITYKSQLMHSQFRNMNNKIFGGFLMREMIETAWFAAQKIVKSQRLFFQNLEDIFFVRPVQIGEGLEIAAKIVYIAGNFIVVKVEANKTMLQKGGEVDACHLYVTFSASGTDQIPDLFPETYEQGIDYLMGRRILTRILQLPV